MASKWKKAIGTVKAKNMAVDAFKKVPKGIDGNTFFAPKIPDEVVASVPLLHSVEQIAFRRILQASLDCLKMEGSFGPKEMDALHAATGIEDNTLGSIFTGCWAIVRSAVRNRTKLTVIEADLKKMNVPDPIVSDFVMAIRGHRFELERALQEHRVRFPRLDGLTWRVDVTISTSRVMKALKPTILMQMVLSDGTIRTMEVPIEQFHQLRFNVATALKDMKKMTRHPIMRIAFEQDKNRFDAEAKEKKKWEKK